MEKDFYFTKDMLIALHDKDYDYGYYPDKGYYKHCSLENVDTSYVAIPYSFIVSQYLSFDSEMGVCNGACFNYYIPNNERILEKEIQNYSGKISLINLMKKGFTMVLLKRGDDGIFRELVTNQELLSSPIPVSFPVYGKWSEFNSLYVDYLKEDLKTLFDFPVVYDGSFIFEVSDEEKEFIAKLNKELKKR